MQTGSETEERGQPTEAQEQEALAPEGVPGRDRSGCSRNGDQGETPGSRAAPPLTPSRRDAQQWSVDLLEEQGVLDELRQRGIECDIEMHPVTEAVIVRILRQGEADQYMLFYDTLDHATQLEIARRVAACFHKTDVFIDADDRRDPESRVLAGETIGDDEPCSFETRILAELIAVTGRDPSTVSFNDDGAMEQMARLYIDAGGREVAQYVGRSAPWEEQQDWSLDYIDCVDRFWGIDDWSKCDDVGLEGVRALCDRAVMRLMETAGS